MTGNNVGKYIIILTNIPFAIDRSNQPTVYNFTPFPIHLIELKSPLLVIAEKQTPVTMDVLYHYLFGEYPLTT